jgi:hypothetical protein
LEPCNNVGRIDATFLDPSVGRYFDDKMVIDSAPNYFIADILLTEAHRHVGRIDARFLDPSVGRYFDDNLTISLRTFYSPRRILYFSSRLGMASPLCYCSHAMATKISL